MKTKVASLDRNGELREIYAGRLESTMQNIADYIVDKTPGRLHTGEFNKLKSFITFNERRKTISVAKASYQPGQDLLGTPEGSLYEMMLNQEELLTKYCHIKIPACPTPEDFMSKGPSFLFWYHPALGPLYSIIGQKIKGGILGDGSELQLEIAELQIIGLNLQGSLIVEADTILGEEASTGKCRLKNVAISNEGIDYSLSHTFWKNKIKRKEEMRIVLHGNGEFEAEDVKFTGKVHIEVPNGQKMAAFMDSKGDIFYKMHPIKAPSWSWRYSFDENDRIVLE